MREDTGGFRMLAGVVDEDPFGSLDSAFVQAQIAMAALDEVLATIPGRTNELDKMTALYIVSAGARAKGLHAAIVRRVGGTTRMRCSSCSEPCWIWRWLPWK